MSGVAVVISDAKSVALVNMIGPIDIEREKVASKPNH
jgi:L-aminopeptidase/D-esterase-like protein